MLTVRIGRSPMVHIAEEYGKGYAMALCGRSGAAQIVNQSATCDACESIWMKKHPEEKKEAGHDQQAEVQS